MAVVILHPTEELKLIKFQKELISDLFTEGRILLAARPLWIEIGSDSVTYKELTSLNIRSIDFGELEISDKEIYIPVIISTENEQIASKLSLVSIYSGNTFSDSDRTIIRQKKQPVRQLKVFRLGNEKELSSVSKCITESKWCKLHYPTTTVK